LTSIAGAAEINLQDAGAANLRKIQSRWPAQSKKIFHELFDEDYPAVDQIPRTFTVNFLERRRGKRIEVLLRYNGITIGDRITDNIGDPDGYRYHDIFHIAHAVFLGWSPVLRALLRCKRKSNPTVDENEDGARAVILEEAIAAIVFSRAKEMSYFKDAKQIDYDLLKNIQEFIRGYEVEHVPLWQWEKAILDGYKIFRLLKSGSGGRVAWDLRSRTLSWTPPQKITV
jgi:MazG C-terminal domain